MLGLCLYNCFCWQSGATCENCTGFIAAVLETLNTSEAAARVADFLAGEAFCDSDLFEGPVEQCANAVVQLIPLAFQVNLSLHCTAFSQSPTPSSGLV